MGEWGREPVWGSLPVDGATSHVVTLDNGRIRAASHDEGDDVLIALGGDGCLCHVLATTWLEVRTNAAVIPLLLQPLPAGARRTRAGHAAGTARNPAPPGLKPAQRQAFVRSQVRQSFVTVAALLDETFRTAMARYVAEAIIVRWDEIVAERGEGGEGFALEYAVRLVLRLELPHLDQNKIEIAVNHHGGPLTVDAAGSVTIPIGPTWLLEVAAPGAVREWWRACWS